MLQQKVAAYLTKVLDGFESKFGVSPDVKVTILLCCDYPVHPDAAEVIEDCGEPAIPCGAGFAVKGTLRKPWFHRLLRGMFRGASSRVPD
ncbi:MAG: hypothetical protein KDA96_26415, partial [Planctomycetaceae bacterium]|nr:hypothetical protein [Planctomycetaceae bacterium]